MTRAAREAREAVKARAETTDFTNMTRDEFHRWVECLHWTEFFALLSMVDEWRQENVG